MIDSSHDLLKNTLPALFYLSWNFNKDEILTDSCEHRLGLFEVLYTLENHFLFRKLDVIVLISLTS